MNYQELKKQHRDLETRIFASLREEVSNSTQESKHMNTKAISVNVFDYTELAIVNDRLTFLDSKGNHYSTFADCSLEDLIDILNKL